MPEEEQCGFEINTSNEHADYLEFILQNPYSIYFEQAIDSFLKYREMSWMKNPPSCFRCGVANNCLKIVVDSIGQVFFNDKKVPKDSMQISAFRFLSKGCEYLKKDYCISHLNAKGKTKFFTLGMFEISFDTDSIMKLQPVIHEIVKSVTGYKNYVALQVHGLEFKNLVPSQQIALNGLLMPQFHLLGFKSLPKHRPPKPMDSLEFEY